MVKYLIDITNRLKGLKNGIEKNSSLWQSQSETPASVQLKIDELTAKEKEIDDAKDELSLKQAEGRALQITLGKYADNVENLAIGLEQNNQEKLNAYGIKLRKAPSKKQPPTMTLAPTLADDSDGVGFIVSSNKDSDADFYEWQKGAGDNPAVTDIIPAMKFFKSTTKTFFVDDDVAKGVRIFYKVRAVNSAGDGPWSEAVSRVQ